MCGIAGAISPNPLSKRRIEAALKALRHRGPDASGVVHKKIGNANLCLLHTRLAIIDLDPRANQPFEQDNCALAFNGEIYNFVEVKAELMALGRTFRTDSDTEVLLRAYQEWGEDCLDRLEGMWAFALFDAKAGHVVVSRDRFGEKPLYFQKCGDALYFASEVKALAALSGVKPAIDANQVRRYLVNGYRCLFKHPETFFAGVSEFPAASVAALTGADLPAPRRFWRLAHRPRAMTAADALDGARRRLFKSVELRLRADVPLAFCLSGGVDSATLAAIAAKQLGHDILCFSIIDRDERYDETANIEATVKHLGCDHHVTRTSTAGFFERMETLTAGRDAPVATISYYVHSFLSESIRENGYKVAVSGTAADELFTGYYDHYSMWLAEMSRRAQSDPTIDFDALLADWKAGLGAHVQNPLLRDPLTFVRDPDQRAHLLLDRDVFEGLMTRPFREDFSETEYCGETLRNRMLNELFEEVVPVILQEDDRNSMHYSVENRSPYLDRALAEFMFTVPSEHLIGGGYAKLLLRQAGAGLVPDQVRLDTRKRGFNASINSLVDRDEPDTRERLLSESPIFDLVRRDAFEEFLSGDMAANSFSKFLFSFISAKLFLDHHKAWAL
jgi:asparagine synthase (glutamine-hydrolysing)